MRSWQSVHRFIALSNLAREKFVEGGLPGDRVAVKPNFLWDIPRSAERPRSGAIFAGRLIPEKGGGVLLNAWRSLPDVPLTIVGDGPERKALEARAPANVSFLGQVSRDETLRQIQSAAVLIAPSIWYEPFGMVAIEAFAAGLPVVASRIGAFPEIVDDGVTGFLFEPGQADCLAGKVREALSAPDLLATMGRNARTAYESRYTPEVNIAQLQQIYDQALRQARQQQQ
jgi:glycosyltransferase involved in cell wall biosynthesis